MEPLDLKYGLRQGFREDELWEKVEQQLRRRRLFLTIITAGLFSILSGVPVVIDLWPKWMTRKIVRELAQEINRLKIRAAVEQVSYRIRLDPVDFSVFKIEKLAHCFSGETAEVKSSEVKSFNLKGIKNSDYHWLTPGEGYALQIPNLMFEFCYDPWKGSVLSASGAPLAGFALIPKQDLEWMPSVATSIRFQRTDRMTVLLLSGPTAELNFD